MIKPIHAYAMIQGDVIAKLPNSAFAISAVKPKGAPVKLGRSNGFDFENITIIPGHTDFKRVEEIKQIVEGYKYPEAERNLVRELIQMLTGDKQ